MTGVIVSRHAKAFAFRCEHCGAQVSTQPAKSLPRNACPECHWSKHLAFGIQVGYPPCGGMMKPHLIDDAERVTWRCLGCGFMMTGPTEKTTDEIATGRRKGCEGTIYGRLGLVPDDMEEVSNSE